MKRAVSDPCHPGAASLMQRSGFWRFARQHYPEPAHFADLRLAARRLSDAGIIDFAQHDAMLRTINRRSAADLLRAFRKAEPVGRRIHAVRKLRKIAPLGMSAYAIRMGRGHA